LGVAERVFDVKRTAEHERSGSMKRSKTIDSSLIPCAMSFIVASLGATRWGNNCNEFMWGGVIPLSISFYIPVTG
jgi:hypothetical protein